MVQHSEFVPFWNFPLLLSYAPRQIDCQRRDSSQGGAVAVVEGQVAVDDELSLVFGGLGQEVELPGRAKRAECWSIRSRRAICRPFATQFAPKWSAPLFKPCYCFGQDRFTLIY